MKRISAVAVCAGLVATSFAMTPAASAAPKNPAIAHQGSGVRPAAAGELVASFPLTQTAAQKTLTRSLIGQRGARARAASFAQTQPPVAHRDAVVQWAAAHGFRVVHASRFLVSVAGPSAALASALGTTVKRVGRYTVSQSAPAVPAALARDAAAVVGLDDRPVYRHHDAPYGPADVRAMSNNVVKSSAAGAGVTIGTVNFAPWVKSDLTDWAADPEADGDASKALAVAPGQITEVPLGGFDTVGDGTDPGSGEVDLDAEAILGAAPSAKQRLYFNQNSGAGSLAIWDQMATDAANGLLHVVSTSWGGCESMFTGSELSAEATAINNVIAAGATVFAASGDSGAYDCSFDDPDGLGVDNTLDVDFPASNPNVVAVGGTTTSEPAPGSYTHAAWGPATVNTTPDATFQGNGSGGGFSSFFSRPAWQPTSATPGRQVPDIAGLADPDSGYIGYLTNDWEGTGSPYGDYSLLGGTSLAAPLAAAGLAGVIGTISPVAGLGNILPGLYANASNTHDVVGNGNGYYAATAGFDHVTGLGIMDWTAFKATASIPDPTLTVAPFVRTTSVPVSVGGSASSFTSWGIAEGTTATCAGNTLSVKPTTVTIGASQGTHAITLTALDTKGDCHKVIKTVVLDTVLPTVSALKATYTGTTTPRYSLSWATADATPGSGLAYTHISVRDNTAAKSFFAANSTGGSATLPTVSPGHSYTATLYDYDRAGNTSAQVATTFQAPTDDVSFAFSGFKREKNAADYMGSHGVGSRLGQYAKFTFTGKLAWVGVIKSRSCGYVDVYVDGVRKSRINLYSATTKFRQQLRVATFSGAGQHSVTLKVVGVHQSGSIGSNVYVDSLTVA